MRGRPEGKPGWAAGLAAAVLLLLLAGSGFSAPRSPAGAPYAAARKRPTPKGSAERKKILTRAESSGFTETTRYEEVLEFLHLLEEESPLVRVEFFGVTAEGRPLPLAVVGDPPPKGPREIDRGKTTVVYIEANIHAGEVEGKEACLMLLRDMARNAFPGLPGSVVVLAAPDFNADGNERISKAHRPRQHGPDGGVGIRSNAQNLDLNRDFVKLESCEVRALFSGVILRWDPEILVDCHTTDGSFHREPITWAGPHNPLSDPGILDYAWKVMLPRVAAETLRRDGFPSIPYGNWIDRRDPAEGWRTFGCEARYSTNDWGLRNRLPVLIETYAYADFETRVRSCYSFLRSVLEFARREGPAIRAAVRKADKDAAAGVKRLFHSRFTLASLKEPITIMGFDPPNTSGNGETPREPKDYTVPYFGLFQPADAGRPLPEKGWVFPRGYVRVRRKLIEHGVTVEEIDEDVEAEVSVFAVEKIEPSSRLFQGHRPEILEGEWRREKVPIEAGSWFVPAAQPLAMLAAWLLEPESRDGLAYWNFMDPYLTKGTFDPSYTAYPILEW